MGHKYALLAGTTDGLSGWDNFKSWGDSPDELLSTLTRHEDSHWFHVQSETEDFCTWFQIVDLSTGEIISQGDGSNL